MEEKWEKDRGSNGGSECFNVLLVQRRIFPSSRVSWEELNGFTAPNISSFNDFWKPSGNGNVKSESHRSPLIKDGLEVTLYLSLWAFVNKKLIVFLYIKSPGHVCIESHELSRPKREKRMEQDKRVEELIAGMNCPKAFKCIDSISEDLCKAKDFGLENYLEYLEKNPYACKYALRFGDGYFCYCPLRVYLGKKLKK